MKIAFIGAGSIGGNLIRRLTAAGHEVAVANSRGPGTLADLVADDGAAPGAVVVDTGNFYVEGHLGRPVVEAFNVSTPST